jgi:hypothetical protein
MKIAARHLIAGFVLLAMATASSAQAWAQAPAKPLKDELVGHWQLVSVTVNGGAPYGSAPMGSMFLDAGGHFAVIVITGGAARSISYFGTYAVNAAAQTLTLHVEASSGGSGVSAAGRDETRLISLNGDELITQSQAPKGPGGVKLTWKKAD